ncbi:MAG: ATP-binding protein [Gallionellaceae bacterium]|jgi:PAS domain S-box-containing protein
MAVHFQTTRNLRRGFGLVLLCMFIFVVAYSWYSWLAEKKAQIHQLSVLAEIQRKSLDNFFGHFENNLSLLSQDLQSANIAMESERAHLLLKRLNQANRDLSNIVIVRPDGQLLASALHPPGTGLANNGKEISFIIGRDTLLSGPDFDIGRPMVGPMLNEWVIPLRYAMRDAKGRLQYILAATLPLSRQQSFWQSLYIPKYSVLGLLRNDGYLLSKYPNPQADELESTYGKPHNGVLVEHLKAMRFPQMGTVEGLSTVGSHDAVAFYRLSWYPLTVLVATPVAQIRAEWWKHNWSFYWLSGIFLVSGIAIYLWLARRQSSWETEREAVHLKLLEVNRAKDRAENDLLAMELDHVKQALDHHSIVSIADMAGKITYVNDKFCSVSGYSSDELLGKNHSILNSGLHSRQFFIDMWHTISSGQIWHGQVRNKAKDGSFYWVDSTIAPFLNKEGRPYQYVSVRTDITAFIRARAAAEEANKAKSQFLSSMSHELRTPLNAILGFGQLLEMEIDPDKKELREYVNYVIVAGNQLLGLVNDLLDLSRIEIGKLEMYITGCSIAELVAGSVSLVSSSLAGSKHITIENSITDCSLLVKGDALRIRQVLINLLSNAVKYNRENGKVSLSCSVRQDGKLRVQVQDTGEGIASDKLSLLFGHFERLNQSHGSIEGAGIGLYVSKQLVEAMQGEIGAESIAGVGSTFWFVLPMATAD